MAESTLTGESALFQRALAILKAAGAQYRIVLPTGEAFGELPVAPPKAKRQRRHQYGALREHIRPALSTLEQPGAYAEVPFGPFTGRALACAVSAAGLARWGKGSITVAQNNERKVVEVLRA